MRIKCHTCGKPITNEIHEEIIFRGIAECPELEKFTVVKQKKNLNRLLKNHKPQDVA